MILTSDGLSFLGIVAALDNMVSVLANDFCQNYSHIFYFFDLQIRDNIDLLCKARDNILSILNDLNDLPEIMKQMPPLPVKVNDELANSILPRTSHQMSS
ncbi:hypothetical protein Patl1_03195 [Pistacia atlantica]|uniref:Uncharacterized protein n=1 Tax=Pistacia atlantica TaxID=434234 RepID=A0ACC1C6K5_9ROSI|nr:hypothetical protein Patl1_03195 [Pistacia atlantica]